MIDDRAQRLTLVIHSLEQGGAERDMAHLARLLADAGYDVQLITLAGLETDSFPLDPRVERVALGLLGESRGLLDAVRRNLGRIRSLRAEFERRQPGRIVSFVERTNVLVLLAARGLDSDVIVSERVDPRYHDVGRIWRWLRQRVYPWCAAQVVLTESVREHCRRLARRRQVYVIPNPARRPESGIGGAAPAADRSAGCRLVAMGRLVPQKGFDLLLPIFADLAATHPEWSLEILGEGDQRPVLEDMVRTHQLEDRVQLPGWVADPTSVLSAADLFVLPSRYEGFGNVVAEALACGLPVVSFDCPSGPGEIIRHEVDGLVVPAEDDDALRHALARLMGDADLRRQFAERAPDVLERFSEERFFWQWDAVLSGRSEAEVQALLDSPPG